jgi:hypothetical protein
MSPRRFALLMAALCITCTCLACGGDPPDREIQQAEEAIASAQSAGADRFAAEEFKAAQEALARSRDAVTARDYRLALNHALDARERALAAASQATTTVASARAAADMAIGVATRGIASTNAAIQAADGRGNARAIAALKTAVADAEAQLQEARTAWEAKDYPKATTAAAAASEKLSGLSDELEALSPAARRRR